MTNQNPTAADRLPGMTINEDSLKETMPDAFQEFHRAGRMCGKWKVEPECEVKPTNSELVILWLFIAILITVSVAAFFLLCYRLSVAPGAWGFRSP